MVAALGAQEAITENVVKLKAARSNLERGCMFGEWAEVGIPTLTIVSDVLRALQAIEANQ